MYLQPITEAHISTLQRWGYSIVWPIEKVLACKERGIGAMENYEKIYEIVLKKLK